MVRDVLDSARFKRLQLAVGGGGLVGYPNGTLEPLMARGAQGIPITEFARFYLARFFGGMLSPYMCLEANIFERAPEAGREGIHPDGVEVLIKGLGGLDYSDNVLYSGSGADSVALQVILGSNASRVVALEPDVGHHERAAKVLATLAQRYPALGGAAGRLERVQRDLTKADLSEATVIWIGSQARSKDAMDSLAIKLLEHARAGSKVLSVQPLPTETVIVKRKMFAMPAHSPIPVRQLGKPEDLKVNVYEIVERGPG